MPVCKGRAATLKLQQCWVWVRVPGRHPVFAGVVYLPARDSDFWSVPAADSTSFGSLVDICNALRADAVLLKGQGGIMLGDFNAWTGCKNDILSVDETGAQAAPISAMLTIPPTTNAGPWRPADSTFFSHFSFVV